MWFERAVVPQDGGPLSEVLLYCLSYLKMILLPTWFVDRFFNSRTRPSCQGVIEHTRELISA